jgi:hypothetical protein
MAEFLVELYVSLTDPNAAECARLAETVPDSNREEIFPCR